MSFVPAAALLALVLVATLKPSHASTGLAFKKVSSMVEREAVGTTENALRTIVLYGKVRRN